MKIGYLLFSILLVWGCTPENNKLDLLINLTEALRVNNEINSTQIEIGYYLLSTRHKRIPELHGMIRASEKIVNISKEFDEKLDLIFNKMVPPTLYDEEFKGYNTLDREVIFDKKNADEFLRENENGLTIIEDLRLEKNRMFAILDTLALNKQLSIEPKELESLKNETASLYPKRLELGEASVIEICSMLELAKNELFITAHKINEYFHLKSSFELRFPRDLTAISLSKSNSVEIGDDFETKIYPVFFAPNQLIKELSINGELIENPEIASYKVKTDKLGEQNYKVNLSAKNPFTGKTTIVRKTFTYTVVERCED